MGVAPTSIVRVRDVLLVTMPPEPDDTTIARLQDDVLAALDRHGAGGVVLDIAAVETFDSYFARTVDETARMVGRMGGRTVVAGMRPAVAITATQLGLTLEGLLTALDVDRALDQLDVGGGRRGAVLV